MRAHAFLWILAATATAHAAAPVYDSPEGGFAFLAPKTWRIVKQPVEQYPVLFGPEDDNDSPYVVITEVRGETDLFTLGDATLKEMLKDPSNTLSLRDAFHTADDRVGIKYVITATMPNAEYRQVFYFVEGPGTRQFCFMATMQDASWKKYDMDLDNMMKTFHLRPGAAPPVTPQEPAQPAKPPVAGLAKNAPSSGTAAANTSQLPKRVSGK